MSDLDPNRFANVNGERKRERLVHAHPFGKIKVHRQVKRERERERERERDVCSFRFSSFFLTLRTHLRISKFRVYISLQKILIDEMSLSNCITL